MKSQRARFAASAWVTSSLPPPYLISGTSRAYPAAWACCSTVTPRVLEKVLYFANYIVTDPGFTPLEKCQILTEKEYRDMREKYEDDFDAGMGAEAIKKLLQQIDCEQLSSSAQRRTGKRLRPEEGKARQAP